MFGISLEKAKVGKACENIHLSKNTEYWVNVPIGLQSSLQLTYTTVLN